MFKPMIVGADGQVAFDVIKLFTQNAITHIALPLEALDITDTAAVQAAFEKQAPSCLINLAAYTAVDQAETEKEKAFAVNATAVKNLAELCKHHQIPLIHLSTDYVFDGKKKSPYTETDPTNPLNVYGQSKLAGEEALINTWSQHLILRVSSVFGFHGTNFVKTMVRLSQTLETLKVVSDQFSGPTPTIDIADILLTWVKHLKNPSFKTPFGLYHYCATPPISWYDFAVAIMDEIKCYRPIRVKEILTISSESWQAKAKRPRYSVLNCERIKNIWNIEQKPWNIALKKLIPELLQQ